MKRTYQKNEQTICKAFLDNYNTLHKTDININYTEDNEYTVPDCLCTEGYAIDTIIIYPEPKRNTPTPAKKNPSMHEQLAQKEAVAVPKQVTTYILLINAMHLSMESFSHYITYFNEYIKTSKYDEVWIQSFEPGSADTQYVQLYPPVSHATHHSSELLHDFKRQLSTRPLITGIPALALFGWVGYQYTVTPGFYTLFDEINVGIHEVGHGIFGLFGNEMLGIMGGTLIQLIIPLFFIGAYYYKKNYFPVALCISRLATNFFYISMYMYDATRLKLPMLSMSGSIENTIHDWNYMFSERGVLIYTDQISQRTSFIGTVLIMIGLIYGGYLLMNTWLREKYYKRK